MLNVWSEAVFSWGVVLCVGWRKLKKVWNCECYRDYNWTRNL